MMSIHMAVQKTIYGLSLVFVSMSIQASSIRIYAAASLTNALQDISQLYQNNHPNIKIITVLGASSSLAKQIEAGAPSDVYFSADVDWMNYLIQKQMIYAHHSQSIVWNRLVVIQPKSSNGQFKANKKFQFSQSFKGHLCTGQMDSVPVGKYAKQSLIKLNWLPSLKGRIVGTDDVRAALAFVERGECQRGIVYKTDALISKKVTIMGILPLDSHHPIEYPIALTKQGQKNNDAVKFVHFIKSSPQAQQVFKHYGFQLRKM